MFQQIYDYIDTRYGEKVANYIFRNYSREFILLLYCLA